MSSRVRLVAMHPVYGPCIGGMVHRYIWESWRKKYKNYVIEQVAPTMFATWPHWKKLLWMAKNEGKWDIKVFREPKGAKIRKSLYGKKRIELRLGIPKLRKKFKKPVEVRKRNKKNPGNVQYKVRYPNRDEDVLPVDPIAGAQAGRIYDLPIGWANHQQNIAFQDGQLRLAAQGLAGQPPQPPAWAFDEVPPIEEEGVNCN